MYDDPPAAGGPPPRAGLLTLGLALFAFLLRIRDLKWGLPDVEEEALPVRRAFEMWGWDTGRLDLDPHTAGWPSLSFHVHFALQRAQYLIGKLTGRYDDPLDFFVEHVEVQSLIVPARMLSVVLGVAVVVVGVRIALRLSGRLGALLTGLVLSASPLLVEHSVKVTPDAFLALFSALALSSILDVREKGRWRDYLGSAVWIGLGAASKYTPVLLVPCLVGAHVMRRRDDGRPRNPFDRRLLLAVATAALVFVAASPYILLDFATTRRDVSAQFAHVATAGHFGHELQGSGYLYYIRDALPAALGWPALVLGLAGLLFTAGRRRGAWLVVLLSFAGYYVGLGALRSLNDHYMLPAVLPVALGLGALAGELRRTGGVDGTGGPAWRRRSLVLAAGLFVVVSVPLGVRAARLHRQLSRPSTTRLAKDFILRELAGPEAHFAIELGGPSLPLSPVEEFSRRPVFERLDESSRERLLARPFVRRIEIPMYMTDAHGADFYYDLRHYLDYDYLVVSGLVRRRYEGLADEYPRQNGFYADVETYCELVRHFPAAPDRRGADLRIYAIVPGTRRILEDRGRLEPGFHVATLEKVRRGELYAFLGFTGVLATRRDDWPAADLYLGTLLELRPEIRQDLLLTVARAKYNAGDLAGAAALCNERLQRHPDDSAALALGAAIFERSTNETNR